MADRYVEEYFAELARDIANGEVTLHYALALAYDAGWCDGENHR